MSQALPQPSPPSPQPTAAAPVTIVLDPHDDADCLHQALAAHDPAAGCVTVHPTPGASTDSQLCLDVLIALGKPADQAATLSGRAGGEHAVAAATAWLIGSHTWLIIAVRTHLLSAAQRARLVCLAHESGAKLIVVWHARAEQDWTACFPGATGFHLADRLRPAIAAARLERKPWHSAVPARQVLHCAERGPQPARGDPDLDDVTLPALPTSDFLRFRADAYRRLSLSQFQHVDGVYTYGLDLACTWLLRHGDLARAPATRRLPSTRPAHWGAMTGHVRDRASILHRLPEEIAPDHPYPYRIGALHPLRLFLTDLIADCPTREHAIARIRGAQAGLFLHGYLLTVPILMGRPAGPGLIAQLTAEDAERIATHLAHPVHAAALATALFTGARLHDLQAIPLAALSPDATTIEIREGTQAADGLVLPEETITYRVPVYARGILAAARAFLLLTGHHDEEPLLEQGLGSRGQQLLISARACALTVPSLQEHAEHHRSWLRRTTCWKVGEPIHPASSQPVAGRESAQEMPHA
ncbi:hypothetical protein [Nonomuraea turcica]|uniref:hypothetical protein n=1 Tax=Nonomuraea sp. G32 TaxID=3067274 RepID=UPI00273B8D70|nr:hypothetical protein [Nonomuraea sp. G32]MDP4512105.1 hypothetical protein [Nonomuraea sp. G32]